MNGLGSRNSRCWQAARMVLSGFSLLTAAKAYGIASTGAVSKYVQILLDEGAVDRRTDELKRGGRPHKFAR